MIGRVLGEALGLLGRSKTRHAISFAVIIVSFLTAGLFLSLANNLRNMARGLAVDATIVADFEAAANPEDWSRIAERVRKHPAASVVRIVEPAEATSRFLQAFPDLKDVLDNLGGNPFPASLEVGLHDPAAPGTQIDLFMEEIRSIAGVENVQFNRDFSDRIRDLGRLSGAIGVLAGGILSLIAAAVVSGTIRLNVLARRTEIEILRLVGATNAYIRGPFLVEGLALGIAGGLAAVGLTSLAAGLFPVLVGSPLGVFQDLLGFKPLTLLQAAGLTAGGGGSGLLGSLVSLGRVLRS